jgi:N-ethylmaleimide reductase
MNSLFETLRFGKIELKNRAVMAPLTRSRAINNTPNELMVRYYTQRAGAGLIITEGTSPSPNGLGYARIPGIFNEQQVQGWKAITESVHRAGGKIFVQLMHTGRVSHSLNLPKEARILAPSALAAPGKMWTDTQGEQPHPVPQAMTEEEIQQTIREYADSCRMAIKAGFDGVELHGANGYLIEQFLNCASNQRQDHWGSSVENRIRFAVEVARAAAAAIGADRVGMRLSPYGVFNGMSPDAETDSLYETLVRKLSELGLLYIHMVDHSSMGAPEISPALKKKLRETFQGFYILSGGYNLERAEMDLREKRGDLVAFGRLFISNPDLVEKLKTGKPLTSADPNTFYTPGEKGYTDYP